MKRYGNLFPQIVSLDNLYLAEHRARAAKGWMKAVKLFESNLDNNIRHIHNLLVSHTFTTSSYRTKYAYYPKFREIYIVPFAPDRIVQHALMSVLEPLWDKMLIPFTVSCRKGRGTQAAFRLAAEYSNTRKYCLKCDISKFYPSINHNILYEIILHRIKCPDTLWLLKDIVYSYGRQFGTEANSPIGNYTSQWFGNLYLDSLDRKAVEEYKVKYIRYCDDFLFFSNDKTQLQMIANELPQYLWETRRLTLSKCDLFPLSRGLDFVGYRFFPEGYILLRKRVALALKRRFKRILNKIENGVTSFGHRTVGKIASAIGLLDRCNAYHLKQAINFYQIINFVGIKPKKKKIHYKVC